MTEEHRKRIQTSALITRLQKNALGDVELMTPAQIKSAEILLKKTLPDLKAVDHTGDVNLMQKITYLDKIDKDI